MHLIGYDLGSSSIKATLINAETGSVVASATSPKKEMEITAIQPGWAEQHPDMWWDHVKAATAEIKEAAATEIQDVGAIGISYQMHGLVLVGKDHRPLRPSIIWCDSRAVEIGQLANDAIGPDLCLQRLLNSPGNFTATKLKWVQDNEPAIYAKIYKMMLPGDYLALRMTGEAQTTPSGLSEGILWDYQQQSLASLLLDHLGISEDLICDRVDTFSNQGQLTAAAAGELGLKPGIPVSYRAGDQPNNALSLNVLQPGEIAATAGTSGVVYGVGSKEIHYDPQSRVNTFLHVNHQNEDPRYGVLLCVSGTGIQNSWLKHNAMPSGEDYAQMNELAASVPVGSDGLVVLPFGNGAERTLVNRDLGASIHHLNFNTHHRAHMLRAAQEGIVFALNYGLNIMRGMGLEVQKVRAGHANMFLSPLFATAFATVTEATVELYNTDGSQGAARGAGYGAGIYASLPEAFAGLKSVQTIEPDNALTRPYQHAYNNWLTVLDGQLK